MANAIITPSMIAKEALMQLENNLVMGNNVHKEYKKEFVKVGSSVSIRKPVKFVASDGATRVNQDVEEATTTFSIDKRKHVSWKFSTNDLTMSIEQYSERYIRPAMIALANQVDADLCALYKNVFNFSGTAGTTPATFAALGGAARKLDECAVPDDGMRKLVLNPAARWSMADALKTTYNPGIASDMVRKGLLGQVANFEIFGDQNIKSHTKGTATGTPLVNGGSQNVTYAASTAGGTSQSLVTDGWTNSVTGILKAGDKFTIAGVYSVNPISKVSTGNLQQFTVLADADSGASTGPATLSISPAIITSGPYQTVDAAPADNAAITVLASYAANLAFHKNAFGLVTCPLELPDGAAFKARESSDGLSVRVVKDYDIANDDDIIRLDILYGTKVLYPEMACVLLG